MSSPDALLLTAAEVRELLDLDLARESQRDAFLALYRGTARDGGKFYLPGAPGLAEGFGQSARLAPEDGPVMKFGGIAEQNPARGLPTISATIVALDPETGFPAAIMDGREITTLRTAAASAAAVDALAESGPATLALLGAGVQGLAHAEAIARVRPLVAVRVWGPRPDRARVTAAVVGAALGVPVEASHDPAHAARDAGIVVGCSLATAPLIDAAALRPRACVVTVGSHTRDRAEIATDVLAGAAIVTVDDLGIALAHNGAVVAAITERVLEPEGLVPIGAVLAGDAAWSGDGPRVFCSVGLGAQDAAAAWAVIRRARERGVGSRVSLG